MEAQWNHTVKEKWTPAPEPEPEEKRQTHEPMTGFPWFERAGDDNGPE
jgi:hypothetical protein